jgi:hypothetical protein
MKNGKKFMLFAVLLSIFGATICSAVEAAVTFGEISVSPPSPTAQSTIIISIYISGETLSQVKVIVEECNARNGICFSDVQNVSMPLISAGNYQTSVTLRHAEATYINCTVIAKINDTWARSSTWKIVNLSENPNGNGNGNNGNGTPGFELVLVVIAIGVSFVVIGQKRDK